MKKGISLMMVYVIFMLVLALFMDDITSLILIGKGFPEANPIARSIGVPFMIIASVTALFVIGLLTNWVKNRYIKVHELKVKGYKIYDIFVFFMCLAVTFITVMKITAGISNITLIAESIKNEEMVNEELEKINEYKQENPEKFDKMLGDIYQDKIKLGYPMIMFICLVAYLLFRVDHKVEPYGS